MAFVQIVDFRTSRYDEVEALDREWEAATEGKRTLRRSVLGRDRNDPTRYVLMAHFDSYESAMENSSLPETQAFSEKLGALMDGEPTFIDLDVLDERA